MPPTSSTPLTQRRSTHTRTQRQSSCRPPTTFVSPSTSRTGCQYTFCIRGPLPGRLYACRTCGADCTPARYHSLRPACCLDRRFPSSMLSSGLVKLAAAPHAGAGDVWADTELLLLAAVGA
jgi:hypothetical protein